MDKSTFYSYGKYTPELFVSLYGVDSDPETSKWGPGTRNTFVIQFVTKGKGFFNGQEVIAGQGFLMVPNTVIEYHSDENEPWEYFWMNFTGTKAKTLLKNVNLNYKKNCIFDYDFKDWLKEFIINLYSFEHQNNSGSNGNACFYMIYSLMLHHKETIIIKDKATNHVEYAVRYMKNHFHQDIRPKEVADYAKVNVRYLSRIMKEKTGFSTQDFLTELRITKSKELLLNTDFSVSQIAFLTGYKDEFFFSKFFKKKVGVSPLKFRKRSMDKSK